MRGVFISHRGPDAEAAERLARELRLAGPYDVWLDSDRIDIGDSVIAKIDEGLQTASALILCLSSSGMSSWMNREWMAALARQLEGRSVRVLPARLTGGELPAILSDIRYADLVVDWNRGIIDLLRALSRTI
jgi:hypothetical protein